MTKHHFYHYNTPSNNKKCWVGQACISRIAFAYSWFKDGKETPVRERSLLLALITWSAGFDEEPQHLKAKINSSFNCVHIGSWLKKKIHKIKWSLERECLYTGTRRNNFVIIKIKIPYSWYRISIFFDKKLFRQVPACAFTFHI